MARFSFPFKKSKSSEAPKPVYKGLDHKHLARVDREARQRRWFLGGLIVVGVSILGLIGYGLLDQFVLRDQKPVAKINGENITAADYTKRVQYVRAQMGQQYLQTYQYYLMFAGDPTFSAQIEQNMAELNNQLSPEYAPTLAETVLDRMMQEVLVVQLAEKAGITVSDEEVETALQEAFGFYPNGTPVPSVTPTAMATATLNPEILKLITATPTLLVPTATAEPEFTATPAATATATATIDPSIPTSTPLPTSTPMTVDGYSTQVAEYLLPGAEYGFTRDDFKYMYRIQLLEKKLQEKVTADLKPVQEQVWARHILVADETTANDIYAQLLEGADFAALALQYSLDTSNSSYGGDLGWFGAGAMVPEFETAAFALKPGKFSKPVKSDFGWHIIQCIDHTNRTLTANEFATYKQNAYTKWLKEQQTVSQYEKLDLWQQIVPTLPGVPTLQ